MKPLNIDFAPRHGVFAAGTDRRHRPLWYAACALALLAVVASGSVVWSMQREHAGLSAQLDDLRSRVQLASDTSAADDQAPSADSEESITAANQHLNYPWLNVLDSLERHVQPELNFVSIELGPLRPSAKLIVEAPDVMQALNFADALKTEALFARTVLTRQESVVADGAQRMRFTFEALQSGLAAPEPASAPKARAQ